MLWFLISLLSAVAKTYADVKTKSLDESPATLALFRYLSAAVAGIILGLVFGIELTVGVFGFAIAGAIFELLGFYFLYKAYKTGQMSAVAPIMGLSPLITALSGLVFAQYLSFFAWFGVVVIGVGVLLTMKVHWGQSVWYMIGSLLAFSILPLFMQQGILLSSVVTMLTLTFALCAIIMICITRERITKSRVGYGMIYVCEIVAQFYALSLAPAALVMGVKRFSIVLNALTGILHFKEQQDWKTKVFSVSLVFVGTVLLIL